MWIETNPGPEISMGRDALDRSRHFCHSATHSRQQSAETEGRGRQLANKQRNNSSEIVQGNYQAVSGNRASPQSAARVWDSGIESVRGSIL